MCYLIGSSVRIFSAGPWSAGSSNEQHPLDLVLQGFATLGNYYGFTTLGKYYAFATLGNHYAVTFIFYWDSTVEVKTDIDVPES